MRDSVSSTIRPFEVGDAEQVVRLWNASLPHDPITRERLLALTRIPDYDPAGALVALHADRIVGFCPAVVRKGHAEEASGWILGLALDEAALDSDAGDWLRDGECLLDAAIAYLRAQGKTIVEVGNFKPFRFYPHTDLRHRATIAFLEWHGFERVRELVDLRRSLIGLEKPDWVARAESELAQSGIRFDHCHPRYRRSLLELLEEHFWENWIVKARRYVEQGGDPRDRIVALYEDVGASPPGRAQGPPLHDVEVVGYVSLRVEGTTGYLEQTGVLPALRGRKLGSVLVFRAMEEMVARGATELEIHWCPLDFYRIVEGEVTRTRVQLRKVLHAPANR